MGIIDNAKKTNYDRAYAEALANEYTKTEVNKSMIKGSDGRRIQRNAIANYLAAQKRLNNARYVDPTETQYSQFGTNGNKA